MLPKPFLLLFLTSFLFTTAFSQEDLPQDYLSKEFHKGRREAAIAMMPEHSVMVVFAAPLRTFSNDISYLYHENPDLYYFTGYKEPNAVLLLFKDPQKASDGHSFQELFFIQKRNPQQEQWTGRRLGVDGVKEKLGIADVFNGEEFVNYPVELSHFDKIIFDNLPEGLSPSNDPGNLFNLVKVFREKAGISDNFDPSLYGFLEFVGNSKNYDFISFQNALRDRMKSNPRIANDLWVKELLQVKDSADMSGFRSEIQQAKLSLYQFRQITGSLRETKTPEELALIRKAVEISCMGQNEVMKTVRPDMSELEIQGLHEYVHKKYGAEEVGYGSIVGSGDNGCILHYMENSRTRIGNNLLLMDVGAEYHGYTADVTRTVPAAGKFSKEERAIYQLVYDAQEAAFKLLKDGARWADAGNAAREVLANGLLRLGIITNKDDVRRYYPHGLSHHIGLDVHDKGVSQILKKDMVITIEPGIYIPSGSPCDKKWWGIGVRIEDDALITQNGYELLSSFAPRSVDEIEKMIAQPSLLDNFKLPPLKSGKKKAF